MQTLKKILFLLSPRERKEAVLLLIMILIMTLLDTIGVASILPFMAVLTNPDVIETNLLLNKMFNYSSIIGVENKQQFLFLFGLMVFILLLVSLIFKGLTNYLQIKFAELREYSISKRLVEGYLHQPYSWFLNRHSADLGKNILSEVRGVIANGMKPIIELIAKGLLTISIIILLVLVDPKLALIVGLSLTIAYGLIFYFVKNYLTKIGKERFKNNELRFTSVIEAFGAIKVVKISGLEPSYLQNFSKPALSFAKNQAHAAILAQIPRFALEGLAFGGIMLVMLYLIKQSGSFNNSIPIISLYVFAGYRLMPALQQIYVSLTQITFFSPALNSVHNDIKNLELINFDQNQEDISMKEKIIMKKIYFNYPDAKRTALKNINLDISAKETIGIVGQTGSGKTTIIDLILGLLEPQKGTIEIDGKILKSKNLRSWQRSIGYVPQDVYLSDNTITANIAFGITPNEVDQASVEKACKIANIHNFIIQELPEKYQTKIGERGIRLSGGQKQRIGIARALYHNPNILIFDEATSSLDNQTELAVMDAVNNLSKNITIILIAHRLSTVKKCDNIFFIEKGELIANGNFEELRRINKKFSSMTQN